MKEGRKPEDFKATGLFRGTELSHISLHNETKVWKKLVSCCLTALMRYPTTYAADLELIAKDDKEHNLSVNERNCIHYRAAEKKILHYMISISDKILPIMADGVTVKQARDMASVIPDFTVQQYWEGCLHALIIQNDEYHRRNGVA